MPPTADEESVSERATWRESLREQALCNAMRKRLAGVPTYSVPEAAALMSISQEYLYRLIQADAFPAMRMRIGAGQGRYVVPAQGGRAAARRRGGGACVESADIAEQWRQRTAGGVA